MALHDWVKFASTADSPPGGFTVSIASGVNSTPYNPLTLTTSGTVGNFPIHVDTSKISDTRGFGRSAVKKVWSLIDLEIEEGLESKLLDVQKETERMIKRRWEELTIGDIKKHLTTWPSNGGTERSKKKPTPEIEGSQEVKDRYESKGWKLAGLDPDVVESLKDKENRLFLMRNGTSVQIELIETDDGIILVTEIEK